MRMVVVMVMVATGKSVWTYLNSLHSGHWCDTIIKVF